MNLMSSGAFLGAVLMVPSCLHRSTEVGAHDDTKTNVSSSTDTSGQTAEQSTSQSKSSHPEEEEKGRFEEHLFQYAELKGLKESGNEFNDDFFPVELSAQPHSLQGSKRVTKAQKAAEKRASKGVDRKLQYHNIAIPDDVTVESLGSRLFFTGPLGSNAIDLRHIDKKGGGAFKLVRTEAGRIQEIVLAGPDKSTLGTARTLIHNKIGGVLKGYLVYMQLSGVGFRVSKETKDVTYTLPN